jgi:hypothetical protein
MVVPSPSHPRPGPQLRLGGAAGRKRVPCNQGEGRVCARHGFSDVDA